MSLLMRPPGGGDASREGHPSFWQTPRPLRYPAIRAGIKANCSTACRGNNFRTADGLLYPLLRQVPDQRSFRQQRATASNTTLAWAYHGLAERQRVAFRSPPYFPAV